MKLWLVRHGEAASEDTHPLRPLTDKGRADVLKVAHYLKSKNVRLDRVLYSTRIRARETARIIAEILEIRDRMNVWENLGPDDAYEPLVSRIEEMLRENETSSLMIVGHLPYVHSLAMRLLAAESSTSNLTFQTGTAVCLSSDDQKHWHLEAVVSPEKLS